MREASKPTKTLPELRNEITAYYRMKAERLERRVDELERELRTRSPRTCRVCRGLGAIDGFWLGTVKTCPACHGRGRNG